MSKPLVSGHRRAWSMIRSGFPGTVQALWNGGRHGVWVGMTRVPIWGLRFEQGTAESPDLVLPWRLRVQPRGFKENLRFFLDESYGQSFIHVTLVFIEHFTLHILSVIDWMLLSITMWGWRVRNYHYFTGRNLAHVEVCHVLLNVATIHHESHKERFLKYKWFLLVRNMSPIAWPWRPNSMLLELYHQKSVQFKGLNYYSSYQEDYKTTNLLLRVQWNN